MPTSCWPRSGAVRAFCGARHHRLGAVCHGENRGGAAGLPRRAQQRRADRAQPPHAITILSRSVGGVIIFTVALILLGFPACSISAPR
jgi:hypothetical protein